MFKCRFHQQTKCLWENIKSSKINLVLPPWILFLSTIIFLPNFVASNYQKGITDIWIIFVSYSVYIGLPLFSSLDSCPPKVLDVRLFLGFWISLCFLKTLQMFHYFKIIYIIRLLKSVTNLVGIGSVIILMFSSCSFLWSYIEHLKVSQTRWNYAVEPYGWTHNLKKVVHFIFI